MFVEAKYIGLMFDGHDYYKTEYFGFRRDCLREFVEMCENSGAVWGTLTVGETGYQSYRYVKESDNERMVKDAVSEAIESGWAWRHIVCKLVDDHEDLDEAEAFKWACEVDNPPPRPWD